MRCWDCHDPHGDATNLAMIGADTLRDGTDAYGLAGTRSTTAAVLTTQGAGGYANTTTRNGVCQVCHTTTTYWRFNSEPSAHQVGTDCMTCHAHQQAPNLAFKGAGDCDVCHATAQGTRRAIVPEFKNAWSHKRSTSPTVPANITVNKWDCIVCHMEGDAATGDPSTAHQNGVLDLRDPDTGNTITDATWGGTGAGSYTVSGTPVTFTQFSRNLGSSTLEQPVRAIMITQCLRCHDGNGAAAFGAGLPLNPLLTANPGSSAEKPFATTVTYTTTPVNPSGTQTANGVLGGVVNVNSSFLTSNSSYHPILGKQNNWYSRSTRMFTPWNLAKVNTTTANTNEWGLLLSCWDCHALPTDSGTITRTITAHGGTATVRGNGAATTTGAPSATTGATLCWVCHQGYNVAQSTHGAGSALTRTTNNSMTPYLQYGCNRCHASNYTTVVVRPVRGEDVHGTNSLPSTGTKTGRWSTDPRPYAFIRNTKSLSNHMPLRIGATSYTATCVHLADSPCTTRSETYTPGGVY